ncbi:MAG: M24 family metallopeptidase [Eggerthellaceae bacterium]
MAAVSQAASQGRIERLRVEMVRRGLDAMFVRDISNIAWLSAFEGVFDSESAHAAFVDPQRCLLHTDSRYIAAFERCAQGGPWDANGESISHAKWLASLLCTDERLGIEDGISLAEFRAIERALGEKGLTGRDRPVDIEETSDLVLGLRSVKDAYELECMKAAQAVTDAAFDHICGFMKPGMTEREVQVELEDFMLRNGADGLAFSSIVACGANGASPHAIPGDTRLEAGKCVVMDFGARARGYCSDMTRMVFIGKPDARMAQAYRVLREANEQVEAMLAPGVPGAVAQRLAEDILAEGGFAGKMGHALGHGVGLDIHESPVLAHRNNAPLQCGNVVTVEPGIYIEGEFGMRLEDFGVITEKGFEVFTQSPHDMVII